MSVANWWLTLCSHFVHLNLVLVQMHFDEGLSARSKIGDSTKLVTKGIRGKTASEKLSEEGLVKFSARVAIQVYFLFSLSSKVFKSESKAHH